MVLNAVPHQGKLAEEAEEAVRNAPERPLRDRLADLACEVDALPAKVPADTRTAEAVLGYDDRGQW